MNATDNDHIAMAIVAFITVTAFLPWKAWAYRGLEEWAASNGFRIIEIEDGNFWDRYFTGNVCVVCRVRLVDELGCQARCRVVIGPMILGPWSPIKVHWNKHQR